MRSWSLQKQDCSNALPIFKLKVFLSVLPNPLCYSSLPLSSGVVVGSFPLCRYLKIITISLQHPFLHTKKQEKFRKI